MAQSVTLSSVGTASIVLNPVSKSTTVILSAGTVGSTGAVTIEMSLDDPTIPGGPSATWAPLSSGAAMLSSNITTNLVYTVLSPVGMVRINSTANNNTWTLKALQSVQA
jgi:hypothetical protein